MSLKDIKVGMLVEDPYLSGGYNYKGIVLDYEKCNYLGSYGDCKNCELKTQFTVYEFRRNRKLPKRCSNYWNEVKKIKENSCGK